MPKSNEKDFIPGSEMSQFELSKVSHNLFREMLESHKVHRNIDNRNRSLATDEHR